MKGWKNTNKNLICGDFQFKVGKTYHQTGEIKICKNGFHFYTNPLDIFRYHEKKDSVVVEIEAFGDIIHGKNKSVCSDLKIIKILTEPEIIKLCNLQTNTGLHNTGLHNSGYWNSGNWNSGCWNSGYKNSGNRNTGKCNSGYWNSGSHNSGSHNLGVWNSGSHNSGDRNSGDWNFGDWNSGHWNKSNNNNGFFNTKKEEILVFNKPCNKKIWDNCEKPNFIFFSLTFWVSESKMTGEEKINHPEFYCLRGYLKTLEYKEAWQNAWDNKQEGDIALLEALPNFSWEVFTEISGIKEIQKNY